MCLYEIDITLSTLSLLQIKEELKLCFCWNLFLFLLCLVLLIARFISLSFYFNFFRFCITFRLFSRPDVIREKPDETGFWSDGWFFVLWHLLGRRVWICQANAGFWNFVIKSASDLKCQISMKDEKVVILIKLKKKKKLL